MPVTDSMSKEQCIEMMSGLNASGSPSKALNDSVYLYDGEFKKI